MNSENSIITQSHTKCTVLELFCLASLSSIDLLAYKLLPLPCQCTRVRVKYQTVVYSKVYPNTEWERFFRVSGNIHRVTVKLWPLPCLSMTRRARSIRPTVIYMPVFATCTPIILWSVRSACYIVELTGRYQIWSTKWYNTKHDIL